MVLDIYKTKVNVNISNVFRVTEQKHFLMLYADTDSLGTITVLFACTSYKQVYLFTCGVTLYDFVSSADFFQINFFKIFFQEHYQCQTVLILSVLIWVLTVCKGYQQMAKFTTAKKELYTDWQKKA